MIKQQNIQNPGFKLWICQHCYTGVRPGWWHRDYKNVGCWNKFLGSTRWCIQIDEIINKDRGNKL